MEQKKTVYYEPMGVITGSMLYAFATALVTVFASAYHFFGYAVTLTEVLLFGIFTMIILMYGVNTFDNARHELIDEDNKVTKTL